MSQIFIYQTDADYAFLPQRLEKVNENDEIILDKLFMRFNQSKPVDYNAHSVSMGDVVAIQRKNGTKWYYYDSYGWKLFLLFHREKMAITRNLKKHFN